MPDSSASNSAHYKDDTEMTIQDWEIVIDDREGVQRKGIGLTILVDSNAGRQMIHLTEGAVYELEDRLRHMIDKYERTPS